MKIKYGINRAVRKGGRKHIEHQNGSFSIRTNDHETIMRRIRERMPRGWTISGYAVVRPAAKV